MTEAVYHFAQDRDWTGSDTPWNLVTSLFVELGELMATCQWSNTAIFVNDHPEDAFVEELCDVTIYLLRLAKSLDIVIAPSRSVLLN